MGTFGQAFELAIQQAVSVTVNNAVAAALRDQIGPFLQNQFIHPQNGDDEVLLNTQEAAAFIGFKPITLAIRRCKGLPPIAVKIGSNVRYRKGTLREFMLNYEPRRSKKDGRFRLAARIPSTVGANSTSAYSGTVARSFA